MSWCSHRRMTRRGDNKKNCLGCRRDAILASWEVQHYCHEYQGVQRKLTMRVQRGLAPERKRRCCKTIVGNFAQKTAECREGIRRSSRQGPGICVSRSSQTFLLIFGSCPQDVVTPRQTTTQARVVEGLTREEEMTVTEVGTTIAEEARTWTTSAPEGLSWKATEVVGAAVKMIATKVVAMKGDALHGAVEGLTRVGETTVAEEGTTIAEEARTLTASAPEGLGWKATEMVGAAVKMIAVKVGAMGDMMSNVGMSGDDRKNRDDCSYGGGRDQDVLVYGGRHVGHHFGAIRCCNGGAGVGVYSFSLIL